MSLPDTNGPYRLNDEGNATTPLAANTGSINFRQSGPLIAGTVDVAGIATTNTTRIEATGPAANLTLNNAVTAGAAGDAVIPKAGNKVYDGAAPTLIFGTKAKR